MSFFFEILVRMASYGPQIDQSHGENKLSHIITKGILRSLCARLTVNNFTVIVRSQLVSALSTSFFFSFK